VLSMRAVAERFAKETRETLAEIKDGTTEWRRLKVVFPSVPKLYNKIKDTLFYEDLLNDEQLSKDFLIPWRYNNQGEVKLTEHLDLETCLGAWRYLQFFSLVEIALLRPYSERDLTVFLNSLVRVAREEGMVEFIEGLGLSKEQAIEFFRVVSATVKGTSYFDLQYRPAFRIAQTMNPETHKMTNPEMIICPALVCVSNVLRNIQAANKFRIKSNASVFVDYTAELLRSRFSKVVTNRPLKGGRATDVDIAIFEGNTLYLFECKHSLPPTGPHEIRDIWEDIETGVHQLAAAKDTLSDAARRHSYITGWFPGTKPRDTADLKIVCCVLCSHRIFSGFHHNGVAIRDFCSLAMLCEDGIVKTGAKLVQEKEIVFRRYRILRGASLSAIDLDDYLSQDSTLFKTFTPFMHPMTRFHQFGDMTIARETYVFEMEPDDWSRRMESLRCAREPDMT